MEAHVCAHLGRKGVEGGGRDSGRHMVSWVKAAVTRSSVHDASVAGETMEDARKEWAGKVHVEDSARRWLGTVLYCLAEKRHSPCATAGDGLSNG